MPNANGSETIIIVDDEWESPIVTAVRRRLDEEGWRTRVIVPEAGGSIGDEFEAAALYAIEEELPEGVLLDIRLGEYREDQFKGLEILQKICGAAPQATSPDVYPSMPRAQTGRRRCGAASSGMRRWISLISWPARKRWSSGLRRLIGRTPEIIPIGGNLYLDANAKAVYVQRGEDSVMVEDIHGMKFEIIRELAATWYRSPGELVPFSRLERYSEGEEARASLRVRIREIKVSLGKALGMAFGAGDLIINVRDQGYRLVPPKT